MTICYVCGLGGDDLIWCGQVGHAHQACFDHEDRVSEALEAPVYVCGPYFSAEPVRAKVSLSERARRRREIAAAQARAAGARSGWAKFDAAARLARMAAPHAGQGWRKSA